MPLHPHDYLLRTKCRCEIEFERVARTIRETGCTEAYAKMDFTVLDVDMGGGLILKLWTMNDDPLGSITLINRTIRSYEVPKSILRLVNTQAKITAELQRMLRTS